MVEKNFLIAFKKKIYFINLGKSFYLKNIDILFLQLIKIYNETRKKLHLQ